MKLPARIDFFGDPIIIKQGKSKKGGLGHFQGKTGEIVLSSRSKVGRLVIALHETMHLTDEALVQGKFTRRRTDHAFITNAPLFILAVLAATDCLKGVTLKDIERFVRSETKKEKNAKRRSKR